MPIFLILAAAAAAVVFLRRGTTAAGPYAAAPAPTVDDGIRAAGGAIDTLYSGIARAAGSLPPAPVFKPIPTTYKAPTMTTGWNGKAPVLPTKIGMKPNIKPNVSAMVPPTMYLGPPPDDGTVIAPATYRDPNDHPVFQTAQEAEDYVTKGRFSF